MDFHQLDSIYTADVKTAHLRDVEVQDEYGVKYHQFWVNEDEGTVFCLIEAPNKEACEMVHRIAHGTTACALTEVEGGLYERLMGQNFETHHGHVVYKNGAQDQGYRTILVVSLFGITKATGIGDHSLLLTPNWARKIVHEQIVIFGGRHIIRHVDESLMAAFDDADQAVSCALAIKENLAGFEPKSPEINFTIGISASQPVTPEGDFFKEAIRLAHRLSLTVPDTEILTCPLVRKICKNEELFTHGGVRSLNLKEQEFISNVIHFAEANLADQKFTLNELSNEVCISRPQLYRKVTALTGRSPHDFINDLRMQKALTLLIQKKNNISEVAYETGFNSPSYFSKCFVEKFGCTPSLLLKSGSASDNLS